MITSYTGNMSLDELCEVGARYCKKIAIFMNRKGFAMGPYDKHMRRFVMESDCRPRGRGRLQMEG